MSALIVRDDRQLRSLEAAIESFHSRPAAEQARKTSLIAALEREYQHLLASDRRPHRPRALRAAA